MGGVFWFGGLVVLDRADREPPVLWNEEDDESRLDITDRLQRLMERDYVMRLPDSTFPGDEEYVFRHRLERERISALTSPADARKWHRLLADWLDSKPEIRTHEQYLEMLAEQREKSGISDWAARAYLEAAGRARAHNVGQARARVTARKRSLFWVSTITGGGSTRCFASASCSKGSAAPKTRSIGIAAPSSWRSASTAAPHGSRRGWPPPGCSPSSA